MAFHYIGVDEAMARSGLRMVVVGGIPSLWGEAAKGILHVKRLDWAAVRLVYDSEALKSWAGQLGGPVLIYDNDAPRSGWLDILLLAEQLAPQPPLLPADEAERTLTCDLALEICGEGGLGWSRRLQLVQAALQGDGGFPQRIARYLAAKYGYDPATGPTQGARVADQLRRLAGRLDAQRASGSPYLVGSALSAADIYCAAAMGMFDPLPEEQCVMDSAMRAAFASRDAQTAEALAPILLEHRDLIYARHLALPLAL